MDIMIPEIVIIFNWISDCIAYNRSVAYKRHECCFEEITFSCEFIVCLSCISFGQYFQINAFKSGEFGKNKKSALTI